MSSESTDSLARLLVVDDDLVQRKIIAKIGAQAGFQTAEASSFEEAETMLQAEQYDCITLDLSLGPRSGILLLRTMIETKNSVPVIIVSGATEQVLQTTLDVAGRLALDAQNPTQVLRYRVSRGGQDPVGPVCRPRPARARPDRAACHSRRQAGACGGGARQQTA